MSISTLSEIEQKLKTCNSSEFSEICEILQKDDSEYDKNEWKKYILEVSSILESRNPKDNNSFLKKAFESYANNNPRAFRNKLEIIHALGISQIKNQEISEAHNSARNYLYNSIARLYHEASNEKSDYFSFRCFSDYSIADIKNETISISHPREFNDPIDTLFNLWLDQSIVSTRISNEEREFRILLKKVSEHLKMRCMISAMSINSIDPLMWAHYASSHKGFCVRYRFTKDFFSDYGTGEKNPIRMIGKMNYQNVSLSIDNIPDMKIGLLTKSLNWQYENEVRLLSFDINDEITFPAIECKGAIKEVYLGVNSSDVNRRKMEMAIGDKDIKLYKMYIDEENLIKLKAERIG